MKWFMAILAAACLAIAHAVQAQSEVDAFLGELVRAMDRGERAAVAAIVRFPMVVSIGGLRVPFQDAATLLGRYDDVFTPELRDAIARRETVRETPGGFTVGNNTLAIARTGGGLRITAIVVPPADPGLAPGDPARGAGPREPRRIGVRAGPAATRFAGSLASGAADSYVLFVPKGMLLDVRLERVSGEAIVRVSNAATGAPLNPRVAQGALVVSGRAQTSADYRIDVRRTST